MYFRKMYRIFICLKIIIQYIEVDTYKFMLLFNPKSNNILIEKLLDYLLKCVKLSSLIRFKNVIFCTHK